MSHELMEILPSSGAQFLGVIENLSEENVLYRYGKGKWSIKDIIQHLIDAEKVFCYRAMRFSRGDRTILEGFEQNDYVREALADKRSLETLLKEFQVLRDITFMFYSSLDPVWLQRMGIASGVNMSVEMIGYIIAGHTLHHLQVIQERYLS